MFQQIEVGMLLIVGNILWMLVLLHLSDLRYKNEI